MYNLVGKVAIVTGAGYISREKARERMYSVALKSIQLNRLGTSEDVSNMVAFLASDESNYITGQSINVKGGAFTAL